MLTDRFVKPAVKQICQRKKGMAHVNLLRKSALYICSHFSLVSPLEEKE